MRNVVLVLFCVTASGFAQAPQPMRTPSVVYTMRDSDAIKDYRTNPSAVRAMVNRLVVAVTSQPDVAKAWASLVSPTDKIGIKICAAGGELFTTHHDVVNAIVDGLVAAGHPRSSIIVWDRSLGGRRNTKNSTGIDGYQLQAITPRDGYDPKAVLTAPLMGQLLSRALDHIDSRTSAIH